MYTQFERDLIDQCQKTFNRTGVVAFNGIDPVIDFIGKRTKLTRTGANIFHQFLTEFIEKKKAIITEKRNALGEWPIPRNLLTYELSEAEDSLIRRTRGFEKSIESLLEADIKFKEEECLEAHKFFIELTIMENAEFCNSATEKEFKYEWIPALAEKTAKWSYAYHKSAQIVLSRIPANIGQDQVNQVIEVIAPRVASILPVFHLQLHSIFHMILHGHGNLWIHLLRQGHVWITEQSPVSQVPEIVNIKTMLRMLGWRFTEDIIFPAPLPKFFSFNDLYVVPIRNDYVVAHEVVEVVDDEPRRRNNVQNGGGVVLAEIVLGDSDDEEDDQNGEEQMEVDAEPASDTDDESDLEP